jgi:hypothetical protein
VGVEKVTSISGIRFARGMLEESDLSHALLDSYHRRTFFLAVAVFSSSASARPSVYVVAVGQSGPQFGIVDLAGGRFHHIANTPESLAGLLWWNESLLSLATSDPLLGLSGQDQSQKTVRETFSSPMSQM